MESLLEQDGVRVAHMQVKEAIQIAELMRKLIKEQTSGLSEAAADASTS